MRDELIDLSIEAAIELDKRLAAQPFSAKPINAFAEALEDWSPQEDLPPDRRVRNLSHVSLFADTFDILQGRRASSFDELVSNIRDLRNRLTDENLNSADVKRLRDFCLALNKVLLIANQSAIDERKWYKTLPHEI